MPRPLIALLPLLAFAAPGAAQTLYFSDVFSPNFEDGFLRRIDISGGEPETLATPGNGIRGVALDPTHGKVYWVDTNAFKITRANLDGSSPLDIVTSGLTFPSAIVVDQANSRILWGDQGSGEIWSADLDGNGAAVYLTTPFGRGIAIDSVHSKLYWTTDRNVSQGEIIRADLTGANQEVIVNGVALNQKPGAIALDVARNRIYWTDHVTATVRRAALDGTGRVTIYTDPVGNGPRGITVEPVSGDVYFGLDTDEFGHQGRIVIALGGESNFAPFIGSLGAVYDITLLGGSTPPACYANCDGSTIPPVLNVNDFICFQQSFAAGGSYANCDGSTIPPVLNVNDFICFQQMFAQGCP